MCAFDSFLPIICLKKSLVFSFSFKYYLILIIFCISNYTFLNTIVVNNLGSTGEKLRENYELDNSDCLSNYPH